MLPQVLPKDKFDEFVGFLMSAGSTGVPPVDGSTDVSPVRVVAPVAKGPQFTFAEIAASEDIERIRMDYDVTILPPKKYMLPTHETLLEFDSRQPDSAKAQITARPTVILGVHPYDLHAIATLDAAFSTDPDDPYYLLRRKATMLIGVNIAGYVDEHQFMSDMGTLDAPEGGFDLFMTDLGDRYFVEVGSEQGSGVLHKCSLCRAAEAGDHKARQEYEAAKNANSPKRLPYNVRYLPELLDANYDSLLWDALARRCFSCGSCTNVCPTCYCFDVQDKLNMDIVSGTRERKWDSCQLKVFAEVAGGENFREQAAGRVRHRMFRKGKFVLERTGRLGCVGCGRCIRQCVAKISILEAFQQIADQAQVEA